MPWDDNLDDFERQLAADKEREQEERKLSRKHEHRHRHRHSHHHRHRDELKHRERDQKRDLDEEHGHRAKRRRRSHSHEESTDREHQRQHKRDDRRETDGQRHRRDRSTDASNEHRKNRDTQDSSVVNEEDNGVSKEESKYRAWMDNPSALDVDYIQRPTTKTKDPIQPGSPRAKLDLKIHEAELNKHHLQELAEGREGPIIENQGPPEHDVDYEFGDNGSNWRIMKLRNVYRDAEESGKPLEDVALQQYGTLKAFDDAREEEIEMDRRKSYGTGYVGKNKPSGELYQERKLGSGLRRKDEHSADHTGQRAEHLNTEGSEMLNVQGAGGEHVPSTKTVLDTTALNRLRAQMMKARFKGLPEAAALEREYEAAQQASETAQPGDTVVLDPMESRMLAGGRRDEVKEAAKRRARERGQVEENEDMSIEDMVREERRTKGIFGNEDRRFASRIAKDGKFSNDLDYMDENATKLAKRVHQSDSALRSSAIAKHKANSSTLDSCPLCHHEDRQHDTLPIAPVVSRAHRTFLTLPTSPDISPHGGAIIVPLSHHDNLLNCDEDEWEEIRNFMKSLTRMFYSKSLGVLFYENAAHPRKHRHAALAAVPVPFDLAEDASAFFREAILASDDEWAQHRKIIDTRGKGRSGFRRSIAKEVPYFHVWTEIDGGLGHVIEDERRWPQGDLFAREVLGGMLRVKTEVWRRQGRWEKSNDTMVRVDKFRRGWKQFDWTKILLEGDSAK